MDLKSAAGDVIFSADVSTTKELVMAAIKVNANLGGATLWGANLRGAYLPGAYLPGADLRGADLQGAFLPAPSMVLLAYWGEVSDKLCTELMRHDASGHPNPKDFVAWAKGGPCPYAATKIQRLANFNQKINLWKKGKSLPVYELMVRVLREKCKTDL